MINNNKITKNQTVHTSIYSELRETLYGKDYQKLSNKARDIVLKHDKLNLSEKETIDIYLEKRPEIIKSVSDIKPYNCEEEIDTLLRATFEKIMIQVFDSVKSNKIQINPLFIAGRNFEMENY